MKNTTHNTALNLVSNAVDGVQEKQTPSLYTTSNTHTHTHYQHHTPQNSYTVKHKNNFYTLLTGYKNKEVYI